MAQTFPLGVTSVLRSVTYNGAAASRSQDVPINRTATANTRFNFNRQQTTFTLSKGRSQLRESFRQMFEFDDLSLRRATKVAHVLRACGKILRSSGGSASTFELSGEVDHIDGFISHNWRTNSYAKFLALSLHYNLYAAIVSTLAFICLLLALLWELDQLRVYEPTDREYGELCFLCTPFGTPIFFFMIIVIRDIGYYVNIRGPGVFLDKICIHQCDPVLKRKGISALGAFLCDSRKLVIVYTEFYLKQLWTVFELASFLTLRSSDDMVVLPTVIAVLTAVSSFIWYLTTCAYLLYRIWGSVLGGVSANVVFLILSGVSVLGLMWISAGLRHLARERAQSLSQALSFRAADANCFDERDRPLVNGMIVRLMIELRYVEGFVSPKEAIRAFNHLVHSKVPGALIDSFGTTGLPYSNVLIVVQSTFWLQCDRFVGLWQCGKSAQFLGAHCLMATTLYFAVLPSLMVVVTFVATRAMQVTGWRQAAIYVLVPIVCAPLLALSDKLLAYLRSAAEKSTEALLVFVVVEVVSLAITYAVFQVLPRVVAGRLKPTMQFHSEAEEEGLGSEADQEPVFESVEKGATLRSIPSGYLRASDVRHSHLRPSSAGRVSTRGSVLSFFTPSWVLDSSCRSSNTSSRTPEFSGIPMPPEECARTMSGSLSPSQSGHNSLSPPQSGYRSERSEKTKSEPDPEVLGYTSTRSIEEVPSPGSFQPVKSLD